MKTPVIPRLSVKDAFIVEEPAPVIANFYIRFIYSYMLHLWSIDKIRNFFSTLPLEIDGKKVSETEFFEYIWNLDKTVPQVYIAKFHKALELFLLENDSSWEEFFSVGAEYGISLEPKTTLWLISRFLDVLTEDDDIGTAIIKVFPAINNYVSPHSYLTINRLTEKENGELCCRYLFTFDKFFNHDIPPDEWYFHHFYVKNLPRRFGGTSFKHCRPVLEVCIVFEIMDGYEMVTLKDGILFVGNDRFGHTVSFYEYLRLLDVHLGDLNPPERDIIIIEKKYYCPVRKRDVLQRGVGYGAPVGMFEVFHTPENIKLSSSLADIVTAVISSPNGIAEKIDEKHKQVLNAISSPLSIIYRKQQSYIFFKGKIVTCGTQAKLIYEILRIALVDKRSTFYRRELAQCPDLIINKLNNGLSVRLARALQIMKVFAPFIVIEKSAKGKFVILVNCDCNLIEQ